MDADHRAQPALEVVLPRRIARDLERTQEDAVRAIGDRRPVGELWLRQRDLVVARVVLQHHYVSPHVREIVQLRGGAYVLVRVSRLVRRTEERAERLHLRERVGLVPRERVVLTLEHMHVVAPAQRRGELDVRLDEVEAEEWRAEVEARYDGREVVALEREVLGRVHNVVVRIEDRGDLHAEERVRVVNNVRVFERGREPEIRDMVALLRVRDLEEAGEDGIVGRAEAFGRLDDDEDSLRGTRPDGELGREELDGCGVGRERNRTGCGHALEYNISNSPRRHT